MHFTADKGWTIKKWKEKKKGGKGERETGERARAILKPINLFGAMVQWWAQWDRALVLMWVIQVRIWTAICPDWVILHILKHTFYRLRQYDSVCWGSEGSLLSWALGRAVVESQDQAAQCGIYGGTEKEQLARVILYPRAALHLM